MSRLIIEGQIPLRGEVLVPGNKNAVLPTMAATLLTDQEVILENVPRIRDVKTMGLLLQDLGVRVEGTNMRTLRLKAQDAKSCQPDEKLVADLRASILFLGPMLARFGTVTLRHPGGDIIGRRSIEQHIHGLQQLGARVKKTGIVNTLTASRLHGARIYLQEASVTATENLLMAAVLAQGTTVIMNAASEPHVVCLGSLLSKMGAHIDGLGTSMITIEGVDKLSGCTHTIRPDYMEAGTWAVAAGVTDGQITIHAVNTLDMVPIFSVLSSMGVVIERIACPVHHEEGLECVYVTRGELAAYSRLSSNIWPGFPTDLMSPAIVLATQAKGTTLAHDWMYEGRMFFVDRLIKMGANIIIADPHRVIINGPTPLFGRKTSSPDIRAGMALVIAALAASGQSEINMVELIDRGYEHLDRRLTELGAHVSRVPS